MNNFEKKPRTLKGTYCESLVYDYISNKYPSICIYKSISEHAHPIDTILIDNDNPRKTCYLEVKGKEERYAYPDTGFDLSQFNKYQIFAEEYKKPINIYFVDYIKGICYRTTYADMIKPISITHKGKELEYPLIQWGKGENGQRKEIIYFPICIMKKVFNLTNTQCNMIKELTIKEQKEK